MNKAKRFDIFRDSHIGFGIRWDNWDYPLRISIAFPFFTITIGLGRAEDQETVSIDDI